MTGDAELNRKLKQLTNAEAKKAIRENARRALKPVLASARNLAPSRSGRLRRSIKIRALTRSRKRIGARVTTSASDNAYSGKTFYAAFQEFGWKTGRRNSQNRRPIPGKGFLRLAASQAKDAALQLYKQGIRSFISSIVRR